MRIFIAYGYNERDRWIEETVFPLVTAFESKVIHGKDLQGETLSQEIQRRIKLSDALIAFVTRREELRQGTWSTHRWVTDELAFASQVGKTVVEVREIGVDPQGGIVGDRARIEYNEPHRLDTLIQLTNTLVRWHQQFRRVQVIPLKQTIRDGIVAEMGIEWLKGQLRQPGFRCRYRVLEGAYSSDFRDVDLQAIEGRLYFNAVDLGPRTRIQVQITAQGQIFTSEFESVDDVNLNVPLVDAGIPAVEPVGRGW